MIREDIVLREAVLHFILKQRLHKLPVKPFALASQMGIRVMTYIKFAELTNYPIPAIVERYDNNGFVFWSNADNQFVICYNSDIPLEMIHWTIVHEIGHIVLGHVTPSAPELTRALRITNPTFEREADGFARCILCPLLVLHEDILQL